MTELTFLCTESDNKNPLTSDGPARPGMQRILREQSVLLTTIKFIRAAEPYVLRESKSMWEVSFSMRMNRAGRLAYRLLRQACKNNGES